jgi:hypothetical protein
MKRIWHPYWDWEDYKAGMWRKVTSKESLVFLDKAIEFTGNADLYGSFMLRVIREWHIACEHNFTDVSINRRAWVGHAACCMAIKCPEYITRQAWGRLTQYQRDEADAQATIAIDTWENARENPKVHKNMGTQRVFKRNTGRSRPQSRAIVQGSELQAHMQSNTSQRHSLDLFGFL